MNAWIHSCVPVMQVAKQIVSLRDNQVTTVKTQEKTMSEPSKMIDIYSSIDY